jgi:hypothetical protein
MAMNHSKVDNGYLDKPKGTNLLNKFILIGDHVVEIHNVIVHRFALGDVEDPDLYAGFPLIEWRESEQGTWVMKHSIETPMWIRHVDPATYGYQYAIRAWLKGPDYTFFQLKWGQSI